jgi:hypothetical protein
MRKCDGDFLFDPARLSVAEKPDEKNEAANPGEQNDQHRRAHLSEALYSLSP